MGDAMRRYAEELFQAVASFGTKDLLDPGKTRKVFATIEKKTLGM